MDFASLHELLRSTYDEMMPLCAQMTGIAKGIAGLGALFYIALRVWASIARAEAIDVFPLLRPFVLGFCIMFFPTIVLGTMNAVLSPVVQGTEMMVHRQEGNLAELTAKRDKLQEEAYLKNPETAYLVSNEKFDQKIEEMGIIGPEDAVTIAGMYAERAAYQTKQWVMKLVHDLMELLFHAAGLIIDTLRTFILIVLSILGPIVFGIAVWDGLSGSLTAWFSRYISVYLWLPVSSILTALLTKIQVLMMQKDIEALTDPNNLPDSGTWYYIVSSSSASWAISACLPWQGGLSRRAAVSAPMVAMSIRRHSVAHRVHTRAASMWQVAQVQPSATWEVASRAGCSRGNRNQKTNKMKIELWNSNHSPISRPLSDRYGSTPLSSPSCAWQ